MFREKKNFFFLFWQDSWHKESTINICAIPKLELGFLVIMHTPKIHLINTQCMHTPKIHLINTQCNSPCTPTHNKHSYNPMQTDPQTPWYIIINKKKLKQHNIWILPLPFTLMGYARSSTFSREPKQRVIQFFQEHGRMKPYYFRSS